MNAVKAILRGLDRIVGFPVAFAHCDIPCGIYDPHAAQVAAHTVVRMDSLIADVVKGGVSSAEDRNKLVRYISVKEQHAEILKHEVEVLWSDYFKPDHLKEVPGLHELVWNTLKLASKAKQSTDLKVAEELLESVEKVAEAFWKTKKVATVRVKSFYPTERTFVYPKA